MVWNVLGLFLGKCFTITRYASWGMILVCFCCFNKYSPRGRTNENKLNLYRFRGENRISTVIKLRVNNAIIC